MRLKTKISLLVVLIVCFAASLIAGCSIGGITKDKFLSQVGMENQCVTYYANGGSFKSGRDVMEVYFAEDAYILYESNSNFSVSRTNYVFDDWYYIYVDTDGNPIRDRDGEIVLGDNVTKNDKVAANSKLYVAANWYMEVAIDFYIVTEDGNTVTDADGNEYVSYDSASNENVPYATVNFGVHSSIELLESLHGLHNLSDVTFLAFFEDEECTKPLKAVNKPSDSNSENVKVFVKYLRGNKTIVKDSSGVKSMFDNASSNTVYYLFTEDGSNVIDCNTREIMLSNGNFNATIEGNGVTLNNLNFTAKSLSAGAVRSIFGILTAQSGIKDLTLSNVKVVTEIRTGNASIYLFCREIEQGANLENVVIENVTLSVDGPSSTGVNNIPYSTANQEYLTNNWLFGGYNTDDEFFNDYSGLSIVNASLTMYGNEVLSETDKP